MILLVAFHSWKLLPVVLCCAVLNWSYILPYYSATFRSEPPPSALRLRLLLANVLGSNKNYSALAAVIDEARPDIVVLQEFTEAWQDTRPHSTA